MRALRTILLATALVVVLPAAVAFAQTPVDPSATPELNTGGWIRGLAFLLAIIGLVVLLLVVAAYVRFAPRFATDEAGLKVVRADRVRPGEELPRRTVDIKGAAPVVVAPPPLPQPAGVAATAPAPAAPAASQAAPAPAQDAPAAAPGAAPAAAAPAPAQAAPGVQAPTAQAPAAAPASEGAPAAPAPAASAPHAEVTMDQEVFEQTLQELLAKGTDKRVAEGQARRAGMIAARKQAAGEA